MLFEKPLHVACYRRFHAHSLAGKRMAEFQPLRMQAGALSPQRIILAEDELALADQRVAYCLTMDADLIGAAGLGLYPENGKILTPLYDSKPGERGFSLDVRLFWSFLC